MERHAIRKALANYEALDMEGLVILDGQQVLAMTLGSRMSGDTFDIHFEKARLDTESAYPVVNCEFARYLRNKYPDIKFLNREDDLGIDDLPIIITEYGTMYECGAPADMVKYISGGKNL